MSENKIPDIKKFFSTEEKPVGNTEMMEFWKSLSEEEKEELRTMDLS